MIDSYKNFRYNLIVERLGINKEIDEYSDKIFNLLKNSKDRKFTFTDLPENVNIYKLYINKLDHKYFDKNGELDINSSKKTNKGWVITINLSDDFGIDTLKHEMNHALRMSLIGKDKMIKELNYLKSKVRFLNLRDDNIENFFYILYLASEEEINAKVIQTHGYIKEVMKEWKVDKLSKRDFEYLILSSEAYLDAKSLIRFDCFKNFKNLNQNQLNKFFHIIEEEKVKLDTISDSNLRTIKLVIKAVKDIIFNKVTFIYDDDRIYKPKKDANYYNKWINGQGERLKRRLYRLYDFYK